MTDILECIPSSVAIAAYVKEREILQFDLQPLIDRRLIMVVDLANELEQNTAVDFAALLRDNGEAFTGAIALHRNWCIATDDKKATSFFKRATPGLQIVSTLELVKNWVDTRRPPAETVGVALARVRTQVPYVPHKSHPLYDWWLSYNIDDG